MLFLENNANKQKEKLLMTQPNKIDRNEFINTLPNIHIYICI